MPNAIAPQDLSVDPTVYLRERVAQQTALTGSSPHNAASIFVATQLEGDQVLAPRFNSTKELITFVWQRLLELIHGGKLVFNPKAGGYYEVRPGCAA